MALVMLAECVTQPWVTIRLALRVRMVRSDRLSCGARARARLAPVCTSGAS
jgi:hypothetical protein